MLTITGKFNSAKIFANGIEETARKQVEDMCNMPELKESTIRIMPDVHAGAGCTIGTTMTIKDKVMPNMVGVDIGCGMMTVPLIVSAPLEFIDDYINDYVPSGRNIRSEPHPRADYISGYLDALYCREYIDYDRAVLSLGTLGGGNHFIEIDEDDDGQLYLVIHTGSRHLGLEVANYYQKLGSKESNQNDIKKLIKDYKERGQERLIEGAIEELKKQPQSTKGFLTGENFKDYIHDMIIIQSYAQINRECIAEDVCNSVLRFYKYGNNYFSQSIMRRTFHTVHNYIDTGDFILRKGAVSAHNQQSVLIPLNMHDGSLLCIGKGNKDWNFSAPHGAGRKMSRTQAREELSLEEFKNQMQDIYTTSVSASTIDEAPGAYKNADELLANIEPTVTVKKRLKPIYNFKAGDINK